MSLKAKAIPKIPEETARVARAAFPKGNLYVKMRDEIGTFYEDTDFADLFPTRGQPFFQTIVVNRRDYPCYLFFVFLHFCLYIS